MITLKTYKAANTIHKYTGVLTPEAGRWATVNIDVYTDPTYYITGATSTIESGTTTASTYVYNIDTSGSTSGVTIGFVFTGGTDTLTASTTTFNYNIYGYDPTTAKFGNKIRGRDFTYPTQSFNLTGDTLSQILSIGEIQSDNEYIIKPSFTYSATTLITDLTFNTLDLTNIDTPVDLATNEFGLFTTGGTNGYFVVIDNPPIPEILTPEVVPPPSDFTLTMQQRDRSKGDLEIAIPPPVSEPLVSKLETESFNIGFSGQSEFILNEKADGDVLVTVNGVTLLKDVEYTFIDNRTNTTTIYMTSGTTLIVGDIFQTVYMTNSNTSEGLIVQTNQIGAISSGTTGSQPAGAAVFYNTTHNKYEYYLDYIPEDAEDIKMIVNGIDLKYDADFYQSSSLPNRLIFDSAIIDTGDKIASYYLPVPSAAVTDSLTTNVLNVGWLSQPAPSGIPGIFNLEVAASGDTSYSSILYSDSIPYISGQTEYDLSLTITGLNQTYLYRVVSEKTFTTIAGDNLLTTSKSINGTFDTNNKILNTY